MTVKAMSFILESGRCSVSAIQRQFKVGYNRAAAITEELERIGAISSPQSNGTRKILIEDITEVHNG
ncbi:DNA translocase FtsK [Aliivibrio fischeri]|uniref:DNA translocase FtsK n=1 Tax=Aliivibrio fischeri TaxID=668 RepID=UPI0039B73A54